ncbi:hypothetical protein HYPSUDRAFT_86929 [Hypholoma sublateritium FD-334 SS-4]|uniref:ABM domain-containing protein n=1 Tax=Hypholoma sublateritium (strain FD-334 SS-4) TaxID=945553 RepID=A0A0D2L7E5_HYPSF|nr:hypothetical protein HYPSUDRAFT_86929 [Hypholoma sublateritium FD-334 SS-4]
MHYVQIISFASTDEFLTTDHLKRPAVEFLSRMNGCLGVWYGRAVYNGNHAVIVCYWQRRKAKIEMEMHKHYPKFLASLPTPMLDSVRNEIIAFREFPEAALNAPVTTITNHRLKEKPPKQNVDTIFKQGDPLDLALDRISRTDLPSPIFWGLIGDGSEERLTMVGRHSFSHYRTYHETVTKTLVETLANNAVAVEKHLSTIVETETLHVALVQICFVKSTITT